MPITNPNPERDLIDRIEAKLKQSDASARTSGPRYVEVLAEVLVETHGLLDAEARELAQTAFPRLSHAEDGGLVVALPSGFRTRADTASVAAFAKHLAQISSKRHGAEGFEATVAAKRAVGGYSL